MTDQPTARADRLAVAVADALRRAAHDCDGDCGVSEEECVDAHPVQAATISFGTVSDVFGPVEDIARIAVDAMLAEEHRYRDAVDAPLAPATVDALREQLAGDHPRRTVQTRTAPQPTAEEPQLSADDLRGGFWPDMTGGHTAECHLANLRGDRAAAACQWPACLPEEEQQQLLLEVEQELRGDPCPDRPAATPCSQPNPCEDGEPCAQHEEEQAHAEGEHEICGPRCEVAYPTAMLRNGIIAGGIPGTAGMLDELLRRAAMDRPVTAEEHVCKPGASLYYCPTAGEVESDCHGGFDVCCSAPELHRPITSAEEEQS